MRACVFSLVGLHFELDARALSFRITTVRLITFFPLAYYVHLFFPSASSASMWITRIIYRNWIGLVWIWQIQWRHDMNGIRQHKDSMRHKWTNGQMCLQWTHTHTFVRTRSVTIIISECLLAVVAFFICVYCFLVHAGHRVRALTVDSCGVSCDVTFRQTINMTLYSDAASTFVFPWHTTTPSKNPHKMDWCELIVSNLIRVGITLVRHVPL